ncbi:metallophosphoesterase [Dyadobacter psychrophilus]|uniref:Por secretion system C-terminal sorting domain-containing protein n=1 Tax=Dyadobacter psychrophilus TaxID=651661 RepID=A0A1T5GCQ5_9BACT|nr:metallophosphoesterase [Dyadobacter psychrophilus]SKC06214.1 Por secretion system C-terminal sorting domain-containing protein [Dyadobacter psychrophilus]
MKKNLLLPLLLCVFNAAFSQTTLLRGPYLQSATSTSMVVRWRTDVATTSMVRYGLTPSALTTNVELSAKATEHAVQLSGLDPATRYYYSIGYANEVLEGDQENYFETAPIPGTKGKYRFGVLGDCGTNSATQGMVRESIAKYLGQNYMNALLLLGDNAYAFGKDAEYQSNFFNHYKYAFLKKNPVFPAPGNHDYNNDNPDRQNDHNIPYYQIFTMPTQGEAGGVASESQAFYSYDYGNVHFLSLDSYGKEDQATRLYDTLGRQVQWIKKDLAANKNKDWIVAYWHHPPYSQGSRNSETESDLIKIRENFIRILERNGVDLILCGHSHVYERSRLIQGHYDKADTFDPATHNLSNSSGRYDASPQSCPYFKKTDSNKGTVYVVSGSAGQLGSKAAGFPHKAMYYSDAERSGGMVLEVEANRLDAKWIGLDGVIYDQFTIEKDVNKETTVEINAGESIELKSSFIGAHVWNTGAKTSSITVAPHKTADFHVKDEQNCINDVFHVKVTLPEPVKLIAFSRAADPANVVTLSWTTEFENEFSHFFIERAQGDLKWSEIGRVAGGPNSTVNKNYSFKDEQSPDLDFDQTIYYRLKMVALDGRLRYSAITSIRLQEIILAVDPSKQAFDIEVIPNPSAAQQMQIRLAEKATVKAELTLMDVSGRVLEEKKMTLTEAAVPFLPDNMTAGIYLLKVTVNGRSLVRKLAVY